MAGEFTLGLSLPIASTIVKVARCFRWFVSITRRVPRSSDSVLLSDLRVIVKIRKQFEVV